MFTTLIRTLKYGLVGFWRNGWPSVATISVVFLVLVGFGAFLVFNAVSSLALSDIQNKVDISVYFKIDAPEDRILDVKKSLEGMPEVRAVEYVSRDKALEIFKEEHKDDPKISQTLEGLNDNPLVAFLNIKARDLKDYAAISNYLNKESFKEIVDNVSYTESAVVIDRLTRMKKAVEQGGLLLLIFISVTAALIIFNTVRLAIYSNREELAIMRLVGASNFFIRGPYLIEGVLFGLIGSILATAVLSLGVYYTAPYLKIFISGANGWGYFGERFFTFFWYQFLFGVGLGVVSSYIAVRRYLKI